MITRWWLVAIAAAAVVSFSAGWWINGWRRDAAERAAISAAIERTTAAYASRDADHARLQQHDQQVTAENARLRQEIVLQAAALQDAVRGLELVKTTTTVIRDDTGTHNCPDTRRSAAYRLCFNAALSGDAEAAAACEAQRGYGAVQGE